MTLFQDLLPTLPAIDGIEAIVLLSAEGDALHRLENRPGTAGSLRVYHALVKRHGHIDRKAAREGLELFAEHTASARAHPGSHPNIDRLLAIAEQGAPGLRARLVLSAEN
ncbi:DUF2322 domain-containing protein [Chromobacterium phragmitis]|uniref:DUF2322 domain-containing protein n=1 Tax=Chromobacterium phragmitis TaxID=2202141 RepID=A0A344UGH3_9NEIS|nr:DUF2322 family protein [Chromobacterium phragmitis]AXE29011.1 DUF2322 domain-containing protein [Chromobacterium phragmitis]AXE34371.1 DUF2322 domain-containing protein [Chromobacterium phragmitis]